MQGFNDIRGTLFFDIARIIKHKQPKAFVLENVKQLVGHDKGKTLKTILKTLKDLDYHVRYAVLNALDYGLPQKRERVIIVGHKKPILFSFPAPIRPFKPL
jgi:DNA (cytosine-5)-methyltransferase 1